MTKRVYANINLKAIHHNIDAIKKILPDDTHLSAVVKADGYGHGAASIAKAIDDKVDSYGVACMSEALELREAGIKKPILILGPVIGHDYKDIIKHDIRACVFTLEQARAISSAATKADRTAHIHIAIDTGMGRIGLTPDDRSISVIKKIAALPYINIEGIFTHLSKADESDLTYTYKQYDTFAHFIKRLGAMGIKPELIHISNSAGIINGIGDICNMVRCGIIMYGLYPSDEVDRSTLDLEPVMSLYSSITYVKTIHAGDAVSYGGTYVASGDTTIATIPVGYADGYPRSLSSLGYVLIDGKRAPIVGRVCMDQMMVDVSDIPSAKIGMRVTLVGCDGDDEIKVEDLSALCDRFPYEFICGISKRVPRVYTSE